MLLVFSCLLYIKQVQGQSTMNKKCPLTCKCYININIIYNEGGPAVDCWEGGMERIPINELEIDIYQLVMSPPLNNPNFFSLGPIFIHPNVFSSLRILTIVNANIPSIGEKSFWGLHKLVNLNLSRNNLTRISEENFRGLVNLNILILEHNSIEEMPSETFKYATSLKRLNLSHNKISMLVPRLFRMLDKLFDLDLSFNPLLELNPEVFKDIQHLTILKCRACSLNHVNGQIYHLARNMEELDLGENLFKFFTSDEFVNLKKLKKLSLDGNQLSVVVDHVFGQNRQLQTLEIQNNRLALLAPSSLMNLTKLTALDISNNKLEKLHLQTFGSVANTLKNIDLSGNNLPLNEIAILLQILPQIEELGIANLSIADIPPKLFMFNDRITTLNISYNKITTFPIQVLEHKKTTHLKTLDISNNELTTLNELDLRRMEGIPSLHLSKNAWQCDQCSMKTMLEYMKTTVLNKTIRHLRCKTPKRFYNMKLSYLNFEQLEPCAPTLQQQLIEFSGLLVVVLVVFLTVVVTLYCTRHRNGNYYTNEEKRYERNQDNPEELLTRPQNGNVDSNLPTRQRGVDNI